MEILLSTKATLLLFAALGATLLLMLMRALIHVIRDNLEGATWWLLRAVMLFFVALLAGLATAILELLKS